MSWPQQIRTLVGTALTLGAVVYAFILIMDPYQDVPFSPALPRAPVSTNQRFAYPALARAPRFDSLVLGTSTARLLDPAALSGLTGAHFANLAMNSATAYEQDRLHALFVGHHPQMRFLVVGVDETWCNRDPDVQQYTFREFPEWMYDENPYNDLLYLFNDKALENAVRMFELLRGTREAKYRRDGYRDFTADFGAWDRDKTLARLFKHGPVDIEQAPVWPASEHPQWRFGLLDKLDGLLARTPASARIVLLLPPLHAYYIARSAETLSECKGRLLQQVAHDTRVQVLDYMYVSPLTRATRNYWDPVHFTREVSTVIEQDLAAILHGNPPVSTDVRIYGRR